MIDMTEFEDNALPNRLFPLLRDLATAANSTETTLGTQTTALAGHTTTLTEHTTALGKLTTIPMFYARGDQGVTGKVLFPDVIFDTEYCYDETTSTFVAPVAGYYEFTLTLRAGAGDTWCSIKKNGVEFGPANEAPLNKTSSISTHMHCDAGDSITCNSSGALPAVTNTCNFYGKLVKAD